MKKENTRFQSYKFQMESRNDHHPTFRSRESAKPLTRGASATANSNPLLLHAATDGRASMGTCSRLASSPGPAALGKFLLHEKVSRAAQRNHLHVDRYKLWEY